MTAGAGVEGNARTLADPLAEALRVVDVADSRGLLVRMMGGMAIRAHAPDWTARFGLAIARHIIEQHGGRIWVESAEGIGSTSSFSLPIGAPA